MATIITRETGATAKGSPLTNAEVDNNFINLNTEVSPSRPTIRPSLNLDFGGSEEVDSRISFTRASAATYFDANGVLQTLRDNKPRINFAPSTGECRGLLLEEQRTNTNTFYNGYNIPSIEYGAYILPNMTIAPDGTKTGFLCKADNTSTSARMLATIDGAGTWTTSIYAKQGDSSAFGLWIYSGGWVDTGSFTWTNGVLTTDAPSSRKVEYVGNGWYRASVTYTTTGSGSIIISPGPYGSATNAYSTYFWGLQTEAGSFATSYITNKLTYLTRASSATYFDSTGILRTAAKDQPRNNSYGYDSASAKWVYQGLILESAATNLVPHGVFINSNTYVVPNNNNTPTPNAATAPDGTTTATKITENSTNARHETNIRLVGNLTNATVYTVSVFVKAAERSAFSLGVGGFPAITLNMTAGTYAINGTPGAAGATAVGNGWWRVWISFTASGDDSIYLGIELPGDLGFIAHQGDGSSGLYVWGLQVEAGYVVSSFIPTYGSSTTRSADSYNSTATTRASEICALTGTNFSSWYRQDEGTFVVEMNSEDPDRSSNNSQRLFTVAGPSAGTNSIRPYINTSENVVVYSVKDGTSNTATTNNTVSGTSPFKFALSYKAGDQVMVLNGTSKTVTNLQVPTNMVSLELGKYSSNYTTGNFKRLAYYPKRLANTEVAALTA